MYGFLYCSSTKEDIFKSKTLLPPATRLAINIMLMDDLNLSLHVQLESLKTTLRAIVWTVEFFSILNIY